MKTKKIIAGILLSAIAVSPVMAGRKDKLSDCNVAAKVVQSGKDKVVVCQRSLLKDTIDLPISQLVKDIQIVKLDSQDEALVAPGITVVSENYILVKGKNNNPYKLFDKKGNYIANIGKVGQGPNEYGEVYDQQIDEKNGRIYILPMQSKKLLVYDLKGKALEPIPLVHWSPKGIFNVNPDNTITFAILPFEGSKSIVWVQDMKGKILKNVAPGHLAFPPDYSNEIVSAKSTNTFDLFLGTFPSRIDSLYNYDPVGNRLQPQFTVNFENKKTPWHFYHSISNYYLVEILEPLQVSANETSAHNNVFVLVDKKTMKGAFYKLKNDSWGNMDLPSKHWLVFHSGYYVCNVDPGNLRDELEKTLATNKKMDKSMRDKLTRMLNSITDNDNNYIIYGKLK